MMDISEISSKFDCMAFQMQFQHRVDELADEIKLVRNACDCVKKSQRFKKLLATVLKLGNQINSAGMSGGTAAAFKLETLVKLSEAKTFDNKISILHYLVKLVKTNEPDLLKFKEDIAPVFDAGRISLDLSCEELTKLSKELGGIQEIVDKYSTDFKSKRLILHRTQSVQVYHDAEKATNKSN